MLDPRKPGLFCNDHIFVWKRFEKNGRAPGNLLLLFECNFKSSVTILPFRQARKYFFYLQSTKRTSLVTYVFVKQTSFPTLYHCCWIRFTENILEMNFRKKKKFNEAGIIAKLNRVDTKICNHNYFKHFSRTFQGPSRFSKTIF